MKLSIVLFSLLAFGFSNLGLAQNKADRKDEKRENERVSDAKQKLQKAQRELSGAVKAFRQQSADVRQADGALRKSQLAYSQAREDAEERLEESSGLPDAIRKMRVIRLEIDTLTKSILEKLHGSEKWKAASKRASEAKEARDKLLADDSRTDDVLADPLAELEKRIAEPDAMDVVAIDGDQKVMQLKVDYKHALDAIAELRRKIDSTKIDADSEVKAKKSKVEASERELAENRKVLGAINGKIANLQSTVVSASRKLQQAQAADQKDSNKPKKK